MHKNTGLSQGKLNECPDMPNCVVSMYPNDEDHYKKAWEYGVDRERAKERLVEYLHKTKGVTLVQNDSNYLHAEFKIPVFGFIDDVEFYLPEDEKKIHFRSASRVGYSDLGINKRRMNTLRKVLIRQGVIWE